MQNKKSNYNINLYILINKNIEKISKIVDKYKKYVNKLKIYLLVYKYIKL